MVIFVLLSFFFFLCGIQATSFTEKLELHAAKGGNIVAHFQFSQSIAQITTKGLANFGFFPRTMAELAHEYNFNEMLLSFRKGRWHSRWGHAPIAISAMGIDLRAKFPPSPSHSLSPSDQWNLLSNTLSGLFCGSINLINESNTIGRNLKNEMFFQGQLPGEAVCTENLTPWAKLLPCSTKAGLGSLLNPTKVFDSSFHQFDVNIKKICSNSQEECQINLVQNLVIVFEHYRFNNVYDWKLSQLFDGIVTRKCPVSSHLSINFVPSLKELVKVNEVVSEDVTISTKDSLFANEQAINRDFEIEGLNSDSSTLPQSMLEVERKIGGVGNDNGSLIVKWKNQSNSTISINHSEIFPPFITPILHRAIFLDSDGKRERKFTKVAKFIEHSPGIFRVKSTYLRFNISMLPNQSLIWILPFQREFLRYTDYPFDPNRGFDLAGAEVSYHLDREGIHHHITTPKLLITMPTPDFTMPYNVITLTSTFIVLFYGTLFNLCYRRFYTGPRLLTRIKDRIKKSIFKIKQV